MARSFDDETPPTIRRAVSILHRHWSSIQFAGIRGTAGTSVFQLFPSSVGPNLHLGCCATGRSCCRNYNPLCGDRFGYLCICLIISNTSTGNYILQILRLNWHLRRALPRSHLYCTHSCPQEFLKYPRSSFNNHLHISSHVKNHDHENILEPSL